MVSGVKKPVDTDGVMAQRQSAEAREPDHLPPLPKWNSGGHLVNIDNREELYRAMDGDEFYRRLGEA